MNALALFLCFAAAQPPGPSLSIKSQGDGRLPLVTATLPAEVARQLPAGKLAQEQGEALLKLSLVDGDKMSPPMFATYQRRDEILTLVPRLPLTPEKRYRAQLLLPGGKTLTADYNVPARPAGPPPQVVKIYPTTDVLPANHLKWVIYFSQPMRGGPDIFKQIRILDAQGKEVLSPWLMDELWSDDGKMLILYIQPGRIKWGVLLRLLLGPVLEPDRDYSLVLSPDMLDADGRRMGREHVKKFRTVAEDRVHVAVEGWKVRAPQADTKQALVVEFSKPLCHMSLQRFINVRTGQGAAVKGKIEIGANERSWRFTPEAAWSRAEYRIDVSGQLEDTSGNTPLQPFDVDPNTKLPASPTLRLGFQPK